MTDDAPLTDDAFLAPVGPVFTVEGRARGELARDCLRVEIDEGVEGLKTLRVILYPLGSGATGPETRLLYLDGDVVAFGRAIEVALGEPGREWTVFSGVVSAVEASFDELDSPTVAVYAEDALMRLRMTRRTRTYRQASDADIAADLARLHGLRADVDADGPTYDVVQQLAQSDLAFLRERARLVRAELWATPGELHLRSRSRREGTRLTLTRGNELLAVQLRADLAHQRRSVLVSGYDAGRREVIEHEAGPDVIAAEITGGRSGPDLVGAVLGARATHRAREAPLSHAEARAWARAEQLARARRFVTVTGTTRGTPTMTVGSRLDLRRVGAPFSGDGYYVTRVTHVHDNHIGLRTHFEAERPTLNEVT